MNRILIVEDDADINCILAKIMQKQGYETVQAFSGSEAELRLFPEGVKAYDLILLDLMLPGVMGEDLIRRIREKYEIPIIVISAKTGLNVHEVLEQVVKKIPAPTGDPDAPLKELGEYLDPPVGKSGVNHRLRKLSELADRIRT